jgi:hypothetical protein
MGRPGIDEESLYRQNSCSPPLCRGFLMYRDTKESAAGYKQVPRRLPCHPQLSRHRCRVIHALLILLPTNLWPSGQFNHPSFCIISLLYSVVSTSIAPVSNKLESANHLADCEETQAFGRNNTSSYQLLSVDVSGLLEYAIRCCGCGGLLCLVEEGARVSYALDESLEV